MNAAKERLSFYSSMTHTLHFNEIRHGKGTAKARQRHGRSAAETQQKHGKDTSEARQRHSRSAAKTQQRHSRDTAEVQRGHNKGAAAPNANTDGAPVSPYRKKSSSGRESSRPDEILKTGLCKKSFYRSSRPGRNGPDSSPDETDRKKTDRTAIRTVAALPIRTAPT